MMTRRQALRLLPLRFLAMAATWAATGAAVSSCGKKSALKPPPGTENKYPRVYPRAPGKAEKKRL